MSAESEGDVAAELGTNCNLGKTMASVCPAWRCPHHLDLKVVSRFLPFDDQGSTYHMVAGHDIEEEGFSQFGSDEDWG